MSEVRLTAEPRTEFGKGGARRTRRAGKIPAVIYGHGADPRHVSLPAREFGQAVKHGGANVLLTLTVNGRDELAIPKAIQRHPIKGVFEHVDLLAVRRGEKVTIDVPITVAGELVKGGLLTIETPAVSVEAEATHLPSEIEVNIEGLPVGAHVTASELKLPPGVTLTSDPEHIVILIQEAPTAEQMAAEIEVEVPAAEPAEAPAPEAAPVESASAE